MHVAINLEMLCKVCIITAFRSWYIAPALSSFLAVLRVRTSPSYGIDEVHSCSEIVLRVHIPCCCILLFFGRKLFV